MSTVIRSAQSLQLLSDIPRLLGHPPRVGLVLVPFARSRTMGALRLDLPAAADLELAAAAAIGLVCRLPDADQLAVVIYTDDPIVDGLPHDDLVQALARRCEVCGLYLREALCVGARAWGSYLDPECPPGGVPLDSPGVAPDAAACVGGALDEVREQTAVALSAIDTAVCAVCDGDAPPDGRVDPRALCATCRLDDLPALFEEALGLDPELLDPFTVALLVWALDRPGSRDVALLQWCGAVADGDAAFEAQARWEAGDEYPPDLGERLWGDGVQADVHRLSAARELVHEVASRAPVERRAGSLAACAWLSWAVGDLDAAADQATGACTIEPEHGLAELVRSFLAAQHRPAWEREATSRAGTGWSHGCRAR